VIKRVNKKTMQLSLLLLLSDHIERMGIKLELIKIESERLKEKEKRGTNHDRVKTNTYNRKL